MNSPGTIPPIVLTLATVKHDDELAHEVFVADIDGVTVVPPDRARVDGEEGDAVHAAPKTAIAIRTVTTRALGCPIVFLLAPKSYDALRREPSALSTKTSQRATTSPPRRQTSQSVWPSSRTAHLVGRRPNPRAREYERGQERLRQERAHYEATVAALPERGDHEAADQAK